MATVIMEFLAAAVFMGTPDPEGDDEAPYNVTDNSSYNASNNGSNNGTLGEEVAEDSMGDELIAGALISFMVTVPIIFLVKLFNKANKRIPPPHTGGSQAQQHIRELVENEIMPLPDQKLRALAGLLREGYADQSLDWSRFVRSTELADTFVYHQPGEQTEQVGACGDIDHGGAGGFSVGGC